jgi:hypothetical protein
LAFDFDEVEYPDIWVWVDGEAFLDTVEQPFPPELRRPGDADTVVETIRHWLGEVSVSGKLSLVIKEQPIPTGRQTKKWTDRRVCRQDVHWLLYGKGPKTARQIAATLLGPFPGIAERKHAEAKIRVHLRNLADAGAIESFEDDNRRVQWRSVATPPDPSRTILGMSTPRGPGRIRLTVAGEAFVMGIWEEVLEARDHLARICEPFGLIVRSPGENEVRQTNHRRSHGHYRGTRERALYVLDALRERSDHVFFNDWARAVYQPFDSRQPDARELARIEHKAFKVMQDLERRGRIVRRRYIDGRAILFAAGDPVAAAYHG